MNEILTYLNFQEWALLAFITAVTSGLMWVSKSGQSRPSASMTKRSPE